MHHPHAKCISIFSIDKIHDVPKFLQVGGGGYNSCWQAKEDLAVPSWLWRGQLMLAGQRRPGSSKLVVEGTALVGRPKNTWQFQVGCGGDSSCWQAEEDLAVPSRLWRGQLMLAGQRRPGSSKFVVEGTDLVGRPKKTWKWRGQLLLAGRRRPGRTVCLPTSVCWELVDPWDSHDHVKRTAIG